MAIKSRLNILSHSNMHSKMILYVSNKWLVYLQLILCFDFWFSNRITQKVNVSDWIEMLTTEFLMRIM